MIFEQICINISAMKNYIFIILVFTFISSCAVTKEAGSSRADLRKEKNLASQAMVREAIESRRFIVRFDRIYFRYGGIINLFPRANFIIIDGDNATISAAYVGRQHSFRPIGGITVRGKTTEYNLKDVPSKEKYELGLKVNNNYDTFNIHMTIGVNGSIQASLSGIRIDNVRYTGHIVPIKEKEKNSGIQKEYDVI
jgi:hypothetical protein